MIAPEYFLKKIFFTEVNTFTVLQQIFIFTKSNLKFEGKNNAAT